MYWSRHPSLQALDRHGLRLLYSRPPTTISPLGKTSQWAPTQAYAFLGCQLETLPGREALLPDCRYSRIWRVYFGYLTWSQRSLGRLQKWRRQLHLVPPRTKRHPSLWLTRHQSIPVDEKTMLSQQNSSIISGSSSFAAPLSLSWCWMEDWDPNKRQV